MSFRDNLKSELEYQDIKVKELAAKTGLNRKTIDNYLTKNSADPSATNAVKIAKALNVTVEYLVTGASKNEEILLPDNQTTDFLKIIKKLKNLPAEQKKIIFSIVDSFHELTKNQMPKYFFYYDSIVK